MLLIEGRSMSIPVINPWAAKIVPLLDPSTQGQAATARGMQAREAAAVTPKIDASSENLELFDEAVQQLNEILKPWSTSLRFEVDADTSIVVIRVVDVQTGEVVRQIPAETALQMARSISQLRSLEFRASA